MKNIVISTGGSGGHVKPAIALYEYLEKDNKVHITTDKRGLMYLKNYYSKYKIINLTKLNFNFFKIIQFVGSFIYSLIQSIFFLSQKNKYRNFNWRLYEFTSLYCSKNYQYKDLFVRT